MVLFMRPAGTERVFEGQLAALVSRDAMIDVAVAHVPAEAVH
jgi:Nitrile hydratase, alpha chain